MANGRGDRRVKKDPRRDAGGFVALPWSVLDSPAYLDATAHAKALLLEAARQIGEDNNGRLLLSRAHLAPRGWNSSDMITKATRELVEAGLLYRTVIGQRPNKAAWYAVTWRALDRHPGFDPGAAEAFERGAYRNVKNAALRPSGGTGVPAIAPPHGTESTPSVPPHGAMRAPNRALSVPPDGHHLEKPSAGAAGLRAGPHAPTPAGLDGSARAPLARAFASADESVHAEQVAPPWEPSP